MNATSANGEKPFKREGTLARLELADKSDMLLPDKIQCVQLDLNSDRNNFLVYPVFYLLIMVTLVK